MNSVSYPLELHGMTGNPALKITVTVKVDPRMLQALRAAGYGDVELANQVEAILQDVVSALDGSVPGMIVNSREVV